MRDTELEELHSAWARGTLPSKGSRISKAAKRYLIHEHETLRMVGLSLKNVLEGVSTSEQLWLARYVEASGSAEWYWIASDTTDKDVVDILAYADSLEEATKKFDIWKKVLHEVQI